MEYNRQCSKCGKTKPLSEFYTLGTGDTRTRPHCKACFRAAARQQQRAYYRSHTTDTQWMAVRSDRLAEYRQSHKKIIALRRRTSRAIRSGRITLTRVCAVCGGKATHVHHNSYSEPTSVYDIIEVCPACHGKLHRIEEQS